MRSLVFALASIARFVSPVALAREAAGNATNEVKAFVEPQYTV